MNAKILSVCLLLAAVCAFAAQPTLSGAVAPPARKAASKGKPVPGPATAMVPDESWVRVGVVAAATSGLEGDKPLRYAYRDGERLEKMLGSVGQIEPANLFFLKAENQADFKAALGRIGTRIAALKAQGRKIFLQFYYSGHGGARKFHLADGALPFEDLKAALGGDRADARVYVLDVCFGASFFNSKGFRTAPPVQLQMELDPAARGEVLISSSSLDEQAYEVKTLGGSIFTSHWIMALRGAGDRNRDGQVTLFEAYNYAYDRTSGYSAETLDRPQHPSFQMDLTGARDMTLARLLRTSTGILFQGCPAGLYNVVDLQRGIQIGELRIPQGEEFTLALEPGRYRVQYQPGKGPSQAADLELNGSAMARLPFAAFTAQTAQAGIPKGGGLREGMAALSGPDPDPQLVPAAYSRQDSAPSRNPGDGDLETLSASEFGSAPAPVPRRRPAPRSPGFFSRLGFNVWAGTAKYWDPKLEKAMIASGDVDREFGTLGTFPSPEWKSDWGFDLTTTWKGGWYAGLRFGNGESEYSLATTGREPLGGVSEAERDKYPVTLAWKYSFSDTRAGALLGRVFTLGHKQSLSGEAGLALLGRTSSGDRTLNRSLYRTATTHSTFADGSGYRVEGGLGWTLSLSPGVFGKPIGLGARLTPYYTHIRGFSDPQAGFNLNSDEMGCAILFSVGMLGRSTPSIRSPNSGRIP